MAPAVIEGGEKAPALLWGGDRKVVGGNGGQVRSHPYGHRLKTPQMVTRGNEGI